MRSIIWVIRREVLSGFAIVVAAMVMVMLTIRPSIAIDIDLGGSPVKFTGYISQSAGFGIAGNKYDTKEGFQSSLFQLLLEGGYTPHPNLKFFVSGMVNADWAYPILGNQSAFDSAEWRHKQFNESRDRLFVLDNGRDLLKEAHVTWTPEHFLFRVGRQIVKWGETDGFRLMDQINPVDQRRGVTDVRFESTILPLWLVRAEYYPRIKSSLLQDLGFEFIFNPNVEFRGNEDVVPGNDVQGIWAPKINVALGGPYPLDYAHVGSLHTFIDKPDHFFNHEGFEYAFRTRLVIYESIITLNYFYGHNKDYVARALPLPPEMEVSPFDRRLILHPAMEGYFPRFHFVGATFTRDFPNLSASFLGGVSPVLRLEAFYAFNSTFSTSINTFHKSDDFRSAIGFDWKVKIPFLNPKADFFISPQFFYRRIMDYPSSFTLSNENCNPPGLSKDNYAISLMVTTSYINSKLEPSFFWLRDITNHADFFNLQLKYNYTTSWSFAVGVVLLNGEKTGFGYDVLENKDHVYATVTFKF